MSHSHSVPVPELGQAVLVSMGGSAPQAGIEHVHVQRLSLHGQSTVCHRVCVLPFWGLCVIFLRSPKNINILISKTLVSYGSQTTS